MEDASSDKQEQQKPRCVVGLDVGTSSVKCVLASIDANGLPQVIATAARPNRGMRKGVIVDLTAVASTIDKVLGDIEGLTGYTVSEASININGSQVSSLVAEGMIATGPSGHVVNDDDLERVKEVALMGKIPPNKQILGAFALEYILDGQAGIKDPRGMIGSRLEARFNTIFALSQNLDALNRVMEMVNVAVVGVLPPPVAAARAVLNERQIENGVALIDFGATTTGLAIYEEGELRFTSVIPIGSNNITNDLAMGLKTTPDVAEELKSSKLGDRISVADAGDDVLVNSGDQEQIFRRVDINDIVDARLEEIFGAVREEFRRAGYDRKLPEGAVLVGGGAKLGLLKKYAEEKLEMVVKAGDLKDISSVDDLTNKIELATAVGLMLESLRQDSVRASNNSRKGKKSKLNFGFIKKIIGKNK